LLDVIVIVILILTSLPIENEQSFRLQ